MYSVSVDTTIKASESAVFKALTNQKTLSHWFAPQVIAVPVEGTVAAFAFEFDLNFKMELVRLLEDKLVHWRCVEGYKEWLDSEVLFKLEPLPESTLLHFEHANLMNDEKKEKTISSWTGYLNKLKQLCEADSSIKG